MRSLLALAVAAAILLAGLARAGDLPPRGRAKLRRWLAKAPYRQTWTPETLGVHASESDGAHPHVFTYYSPTLVADLRAGRVPYRKGAAMVKELYAADGRLLGHAVMRKLRRRSGKTGKGWFFYERSGGTEFARGRGAAICVSCHRAGADYLLSSFRP